MAAGLILGLGLTRLWFMADVFLVLLVFYRGRAVFRTHPAVLITALVLALSATWSPDPVAGILAAVRIISLYSVAAGIFAQGIAVKRLQTSWWRLRSPAARLGAGLGAVLAVQLVLALAQWPNEDRLFGLSLNASQMGQSGMVVMAWPMLAPLGAVTLGLSTARSAAAGLIIFAIFTRTRWLWLWAAVAAFVFLFVMFAKTPDRLSTGGINEGWMWRTQIIDRGASDQELTDELLEACGPVRPRVWSWYGYGYHGYCAETGLQRPHNLWILSAWDLGIFAVPFWSALFYGAWKLRRNPMVLGLLAVGMITEEMFARPEGFYMIAIAFAAKRPASVDVEAKEMHDCDRYQAGENVMHPKPLNQPE